MLLDSKRKLLLIILCFCFSSSYSQNACIELEERLKSGNLLNISGLVSSTSECPNLVGQLFLRKGNNQLAEKYFNDYLKSSSKGSKEEAEALNGLGIIYWNTGNSIKAVEYVQRALEIRTTIFGNNHELTAASYNDLGLILSNNDPEKALDYYEDARLIYTKIYGVENEKTVQALINEGIAYRQLEFYGDAINSFESALGSWQNLYPEGHPNEAFIINNIGQTKQLTNDLDGALAMYEKALIKYIQFYGKQHPEVASTHNLIGNIYNIKGEFDQALSYYQQALVSNSNSFNSDDLEKNPSADDYFNANTLLNSLFYKSKAFADLHYNRTLKFSDLKLSLTTLQSCDTLIDNIRQIRTNEEDKLALGQLASTVYETGVELCKAMGDVVVKKDEYYELSFYFAEKSKSAVLLEAISDANAKSFAGIDAEDLSKEDQLKNDIAYFENQLIQESDDNKRSVLRSSLLSKRSDYENFVRTLEQKYPDYYDLKYNTSLPTVEQVQSKLAEGQVVLSYFITDVTKRVYIFETSKDKLKIHNNPQTEDFNHYISGFRNSIYFKVKDVYEQTAYDLYQILIPKKLGKNTEHLIIIPAGRLGTLPFEALLTEKAKNAPFQEMPFLIKKFKVSYAYSSALIEGAVEPSGNQRALLCAPVNFEDLPSLPGTEKELNALQSILTENGVSTEIKLNEQASEELVKGWDFNGYRYVHLATHGVVDEDNPSLSRIFLKSNDSEDGNLFTGEIYNLNFNAELVTLSACETGLGKLSKGEGVIGLSRALLYAGANNIVVSLWSVSDASTADLMTSFYKNSTGNVYSKPLQISKLELIESKKYAEPYYWAPFILIGL